MTNRCGTFLIVPASPTLAELRLHPRACARMAVVRRWHSSSSRYSPKGIQMKRQRSKLTYSNVVSTFCLFLLLGGNAYATLSLPKNSVGSKQLKPNSVTGNK